MAISTASIPVQVPLLRMSSALYKELRPTRALS